MKQQKLKLSAILVSLIVLGVSMGSCSKSSTGGGTPPPNNPGGYDSAGQIQSSALVAYFPFNGNYNDVKSGLSGTPTSVSFTTGIKGEAYQGSGSGYLIVPLSGVRNLFAGSSMQSLTVSFWLLEPQEPIYATSGNYTPGQGPEGVLFMYDTANPNHQDLIHFDVEPYAPLTQDTMSLNAGFTLTGATTTGAYVGSTTGGTEGVVPNGRLDTAINKWTQIVLTYNGPGSTYTLYENGTAVSVNSAWSSYTSPNPATTILTGPTGDPASMGLGVLNYTPAPVGLVIGAWCGTANVAGFTPNQYTGSYKGALDELRIYNTALNATDVKSLYVLEKAGF